ncbi:exosome RNA helicase MTR4-like [Tamandua tetradactyla]|uniref:exosome RNA helicase MTR4-like n=1 Tax=Tamandua tetradactyla TaxID=48850 RepID=UPI004053EDDE
MRKRIGSEFQLDSANSGKNKRDEDFEGIDESILGKKPRVEESVTEDLSLADLMPRVKVQAVETVEGCTHEATWMPHIDVDLQLLGNIRCLQMLCTKATMHTIWVVASNEVAKLIFHERHNDCKNRQSAI